MVVVVQRKKVKLNDSKGDRQELEKVRGRT